MKKIIDSYAINDTGRKTLERLRNILKARNPKTADIAFNLLLTYDDETEMNRFIKELAQYISDHSAKRHVYQCYEAELDKDSPLAKWRKNAGAIFIFADTKHSLEQRKQLGQIIEKMPEIIFCLCIPTDECVQSLKPDDHLYYRVFSEHIHISHADPVIITSRFLTHLGERGFEVTDAFANDISAYITTVYPKADLKDEAFIEDLIRRVVNNHFGSGNETDIITEASVPFYRKPTEATVHNEKQKEADNNNVAAPGPADSNHAQQEIPETSDKVKKSKRGSKSKKNKLQLNDNFNKDLPRKGSKRAKTCNIMLLSLSTFPTSISECTYAFNGTEGGTYIYQLEPVVRMLSKQLLNSPPGDCLDYLVMLCTNGTKEKQDIKLPDGTVRKNISALEFFKERVRDYLNPDLDDNTRFIRQDVDENNPSRAIRETVDMLRDLKGKLPHDTKIQLFVDRHGGFRGVQQYLDAILSLLRDEFPVIESYDVRFKDKKSDIEYLPHESIFDFVSGINEFTDYGRADSLSRYYSSDTPIISNIISIANAIQLCDIFGFEKGLDDLTQYFKNQTTDKEFLLIFEEAIKKDYYGLLTENRTTIAEIEWCIRKGFYQQALTLIEGAMPKELYECGVISYPDELISEVSSKTPYYEANVYIFNHSVVKMINHDIRNDMLKKKLYYSTSLGTDFNRKAQMTYANNLITNTVFNDKDFAVDSKYCHIDYNVNNISQFYTFIALHCALKNLRNESNHGAGKPYPISLETLIEALNRYIQLAKIFETYAKSRKN